MRRLRVVRCGQNPRVPKLLEALELPEGSICDMESGQQSAVPTWLLSGGRQSAVPTWLSAGGRQGAVPTGASEEADCILFLLCADAFGPCPEVPALLREIRRRPGCLAGKLAGVLALGETETDTKAMARQFFLTADLAGCGFPERPLVEATGSLQNLAVTKKREGLPSLEAALRFAAQGLARRLLTHRPPRFDRPRLLVLHASDRATSNTLSLADMVCSRLDPRFQVSIRSLRNGTIEDCRGCSYKVCSHFASKGACFYGGSIAQEVLPAVLECDALLLLLPNYNDAMGANVMAFINRLTSLHVSNALTGKRLWALVVSGYSGGDLVAQQALGALCLNKSLLLPPGFCMMETANDPGQIKTIPGIQEAAAAFAAHMGREMLRE